MTLARANSWRIGKPTLLSSLAKVRLGSVVSIVAPAGYGKTTALQAWQENADLRAIGVRLGPEHNDEAALALHLIDALGGLVPTIRDVMEGGRPGDGGGGRAGTAEGTGADHARRPYRGRGGRPVGNGGGEEKE